MSQRIKITTTEGDIIIKLYDQTPQHRDNFIKLVKEGYYNGTLFHRVIKEFMIQGGDPESKGAPAEKQLGSGGPGYTIPAEFIYPQLFHKRGALSAARTGDEINPHRASSGSQFYIVWGKVYKEQQVVDQLTRIGHLQLPEVSPILGSPQTTHYRNKLDFAFSNHRWVLEY